ncbi:hypothetical protein CVIRNUC_007306 [Coccomyxa viridis]|uniref:Ribosomal protein L12 n=1 Tax=Coccomyxa viridis TaxID=1274662 RepID=A0AAV1IA71_9CHLO|nr:hypothetical protein CVIRNUC_007306 [Coccomyxa viridis]
MLRGALSKAAKLSSSARCLQPVFDTAESASCRHHSLQCQFSDCASWIRPSFSSHGSLAVRWYAAAPDPLDVNGSGDSEEEQERVIDNPRVHKLVDQICEMNILEIADLTELLRKRLGITAPPPGMYAMGAAQAAPAASAPAAEEPKAEEKTEFDVKLAGFDAAAKIKVIKEVRSITALGLKEAKELVEKAPTVVKAGLKKEEAEELKKKLEAAGGKVELE